MFVNPSPNWKASTVAWRESPIRSEKGAIIGIVMAALAVADGMKRLMNVCIPYIMLNEASGPAPLSEDSIECSMVPIILPSCRMIMIPEARPTMNAAENMSFAPAMNSSEILPAPYPEAIPDNIARARNNALISGMYHPKQIVPMTRYTIVNASRTTI